MFSFVACLSFVRCDGDFDESLLLYTFFFVLKMLRISFIIYQYVNAGAFIFSKGGIV